MALPVVSDRDELLVATFEDERLEFSSDSCSDCSDDELGPYSAEPLADEKWLSEFRKEKEKEDNRHRQLQEGTNGVAAVRTW